uniref:ADP-ribose pyrophosphatase, mitochondrial n=1 Tax=Trichuris muris TaxID=70415 RepID=A0A5S6QQC8_TRIMR
MEHLLPIIFLSYSYCVFLQAAKTTQPMAVPERVPVPEEFTDWKISFLSYHPSYWIAPCSFGQCDPDTTFLIAKKFNKKDGEVDRRMARRITMHRPKYDVSQGLPLNPSGRTGLAGRGYLPRWGPSHLVKVVLIKKRHKKMAYLKLRDGLTLQDDVFSTFVANLSSKKLSERVTYAIRKSPKLCSRGDIAKKVLHKAEHYAIKVAAESIPSPLDTDNAWVELSIYVIPCAKVRIFCEAVMKDKAIAAKYEWSTGTDTKSYLSSIQSLEKMGGTAKDGRQNDQLAMRHSHWDSAVWNTGRTVLAIAGIALYGLGVGLALSGLPVVGLSIIAATSIITLIVSLIYYIVRVARR